MAANSTINYTMTCRASLTLLRRLPCSRQQRLPNPLGFGLLCGSRSRFDFGHFGRE